MSNQPNPDDPVTRGEFDEAIQMVKVSFDQVATKQELGEVKEELSEIKNLVETILAIVQSLDEDRKEHRSMADIPERVENLEEDVLKIKTKVFSEG